MNISTKYILLTFFLSTNIFADLSIGYIEEDYVNVNDNLDRRIQIYYPFEKKIDSNTTFIIMNDGEELFYEKDSWHGKAWNIDDSFKRLKESGYQLNIVIVAIDSARRAKGGIIDETRRYSEYFPKDAIPFFKRGFKKYIYGSFIDIPKMDYLEFLEKKIVPYIENKFNVTLNNTNLGIICASMGGLNAINAQLEYPDLFGFAGCISTHWIGIKISEYLALPFSKKISGDPNTTTAIIKYIESKSEILNDQKLYFDHGSEGFDRYYSKPQEQINQIFDINNINYDYKKFEGDDHEPKYFGRRFDSILIYLLDI